MVRVLLDEDLDVRLRLQFRAEFRVETVVYRGWKGRRNGELLQLAEKEFDVLVTGDTKLSSQQNLSRFDIAVLVLRPRSKALQDLIELVPEIERVLSKPIAGGVSEVFPASL